ncbi:MAG: hypothetical protein H7Z38_19915, partial [Rubrivivax sp.]|nr:hypothetical protein [Pyrinomonadaceae bacterium]
AVYAVIDARSNQGGGWISLKGIGVYIVTLPTSFLGEVLGMKPDYRRNLDMVFAIGTCAVLMYFAGAGLARLAPSAPVEKEPMAQSVAIRIEASRLRGIFACMARSSVRGARAGTLMRRAVGA